MTAAGVRERQVSTPLGRVRVWEKGEGEALGVLAGLFGLGRWIAFLDLLAEHRRVVVPSLPGFPGGGSHESLDGVADWTAATLDVLDASELAGKDLVACSFGAMLALEAACASPTALRSLVVVSPLGLFDETQPGSDWFCALPAEWPSLLCAQPERAAQVLDCPPGADEADWQIARTRAAEAVAHALWPIPDRGLKNRLHRLRTPALIVSGACDRILPASCAQRFADHAPGSMEVRVVAGAGHAVELDAPAELAQLVLAFLAKR